MNRRLFSLSSLALLGVASLPLAATAAEPHLEQAIAQGKQIFTHETFGGNGRVCETCHAAGGTVAGKLPNGSAIPSLGNAAAIFPRYREKSGQVVTLSDQIRACVAGALQGTPPDYGSKELNSLVSYVSSLASGKAIDMGGKPQ